MALLPKPILRVASAIFSNLAVVWIVASLAITDPVTLLGNILLAIVFTGLAIKAESLLNAQL